MREIKFRAWLPDVKKVVSLNNEEIDDVIEDGGEVMQYTGLKDKNGVDIYESDLVRDHNGVGVVEYIEEEAAYRVNYTGPTTAKWFLDYNLRGERESIEVIGNIYENPELIE